MRPNRSLPAASWLPRTIAALVVAVAVLIGVAVGPARAAPEPAAPPLDLPVVVRGDGVVVRAEEGLDALAHEVAARAPGKLALVREDLAGLPAPEQVEIRLVKRTEDLSRGAPAHRGAPAWARGVAYPDLGVVVVATRRAHEPIDAVRVVDHELAHLALGAALGGRAPRWLDEGFAFLHASELSMTRVQLLAGMAWSGDVAGLAELERLFYAGESAVDRAYAQSNDLVAFLARRGRYPDRHDDGDRWPFRSFLAEIAAGEHPDAAAREAYGTSLHRLFGEWREDLRERYLLVPASLFAAGLWVLAAFLLVVGYVRRRGRNRQILELWEREEAARRSAGWPGSVAPAIPVTDVMGRHDRAGDGDEPAR